MTPPYCYLGKKRPPPYFGARNMCCFWCLYAWNIAMVTTNPPKRAFYMISYSLAFHFCVIQAVFVLKTGLIFIWIKKLLLYMVYPNWVFNVWLVFDRKPHISFGTPRIWGLPLKWNFVMYQFRLLTFDLEQKIKYLAYQFFARLKIRPDLPSWCAFVRLQRHVNKTWLITGVA